MRQKAETSSGGINFDRLQKILAIYLLICFTLFLITCHKPPIAKYQLLSESSQRILSVTEETYLRIAKLQHQFTVTTADRDKPITRDTFKPIIDGQSFDLLPELRFRETAIEVLVNYFRVLQALAERDFVSEVNPAAEKLAGSLKSLTESSARLNRPVTKQGTGLLASGANAIGRSIKRFVDLMLDRIIAHANVARPDYDSPQRFAFDLRIADTINEGENINRTLDKLSQAINEIPPAHAAVRKMLDKKPETWATLQQLTKDINQISKSYR